MGTLRETSRSEEVPRQGWSAHAWRLAHAREYLALYGVIDIWAQTHEAALRETVAAGDRTGDAVMLTFLAAVPPMRSQ